LGEKREYPLGVGAGRKNKRMESETQKEEASQSSSSASSNKKGWGGRECRKTVCKVTLISWGWSFKSGSGQVGPFGLVEGAGKEIMRESLS